MCDRYSPYDLDQLGQADGEHLPDTYDPDTIPEVGELDELQPFVGSKNGATPLRFPQQGNVHQDNKLWFWTAVNHFNPGILGWVVGDPSADTVKPPWAMVSL